VAWFWWRAQRRAWRAGDQFSMESALRPGDLAHLLKIAADRPHVAESGTGTGWSAIALALAHPDRTVVTFDPVDRPERALYLGLVGPKVRSRIEFCRGTGESGGQRYDRKVDLLFIDSSHERERTVREFTAWRPRMNPGGVVVFDDYASQRYSEVREAVGTVLQLRGDVVGSLFAWHAPPAPAPASES
jgi:predicted O-methyltransferase YrrM